MNRHVLDFLGALWPEPLPDGARLVIWTLGRAAPPAGEPYARRRALGSYSHWTRNLEQAAAIARAERARREVYFGVALQDPDKARAGEPRRRLRSVRGGKESALLLPALFADLDVAAPGHPRDDLPPTPEDALGLLEATPPPSIVVQSGVGRHVYWLMKEALEVATEAGRALAEDLLGRVQKALARRAAENGWHVDAMADVARVMRLPGTFHHKYARPSPVAITDLRRDRLYTPADFDHLPPAAPAGERRKSFVVRPGGEDRRSDPDFDEPADLDAVRAGCAWLEHVFADSRTIQEEEWRAALSNVLWCRSGDAGGRELCHLMSRDHPTYSAAETDAKIDRTMRRSGPYKCATIADRFSTPVDRCSGCAHLELDTSPIVLGRPKMLADLRAKLAWRRATDAEADALQAAEAGRAGAREASSRTAAPPTAEARDPAARSATAPPTAAARTVSGSVRERVVIEVTPREDEVNDLALAALAARETNLFARAGVLVQIVPSLAAERAPDDPAPLAQPVQEARLRELLARHCDFRKTSLDRSGLPIDRQVHPPQWCARALLHRGEWEGLARLRGVVEGPVLRPDGSVLQAPGYDRASGLYYAHPFTKLLAVPDKPTAGEVADALAAVNEAVCDFPFASDDHHAAWLSALLTPLARYAFHGPSPLNLIDANVRGAGKSLLADVCATILTGRPAERMSYTRDDDELRKSITALAIEATPLALIDNVRGNFGSATLDRALTATTWRDRLLGGNVQMVSTLRIVWFATGNNVTLQGDTPRRCLHVRLESPEERPEERSGFRHPRLLDWIAGERRRLLPAAVTLLRAYVVAGRPDMGLPAWGSYEGWSDLVRSTVVWLGLPDPAATRGGLEDSSESGGGALLALLEGLDEVVAALGGEATARAVLEALHEQPLWYGTLRAALGELFPKLRAGDLPTSAQLSYKLRSLRGRVVAGCSLQPAGRRKGGMVWRIARTD